MSEETIGEHVAAIVISSFGVLLNSGSLIVMLLNFARIFGNVESCFVANLAVADLLTSIGGVLWGISAFVHYAPGTVSILLIIMWITVAASFLTLLCMAGERLIVVVSPLRAQRQFRKPQAYLCCAIVWVVSIISGSMIAVSFDKTLFFMTAMFEVSLTITIISYIVIYCTIKKLRSVSETARYNARSATTSVELNPETESVIHHRVTVRQESRVTNMIFVLIIVLIITVLPYMILLQVNVGYLLFCKTCEIRLHLMKILGYMFPVELVNFVLNPIIYAWRLPKFRQALKKTYGRFLCCKSFRKRVNTDGATVNTDSDDSGSLDNGPATIFTGGGKNSTEIPLKAAARRT